MQWNMLAGTGVDAPQAWSNLLADQRAGGKGVVVAVLDTGVAYRNWGKFRISPDFRGSRFVAPHDFVARNAYPLDRNGHGTFVAAAVAEPTNNAIGLTGLAYGASIMPVRVLNQHGAGAESTIAKGIRYAVDHGARVINLSLEFLLNRVRAASQIPLIVQRGRLRPASPGAGRRRSGQRSGVEAGLPGAGSRGDLGRRHHPGRLSGVLLQRRPGAGPGRARRWRRRGGRGRSGMSPGPAAAADVSGDPLGPTVRRQPGTSPGSATRATTSAPRWPRRRSRPRRRW